MSKDSSPKKKKSLFRRILKWSGITLLLLITTAIALPFIFKDKLIAMAKEEVDKNVNAKVSWGDFDLSLISSFPSFRFTIKDVKVIGINEFAKDTLANLPELKLDLDLMSVIKGDQYKVNSVSLDHPRILAKVLFDGKANWDIAKPDTTAAKTPEAASEPTKFKLTLNNLEIKNAYIVYDDASLAFKTVLNDFTYNLKGDFTQDNFVMKNELSIAKFSVDYDGMTYLKEVKTAAKADLDMDMVKWKFTFKDNEFNLNELGFGLDGFFAMPGEDYDMDLKFKAKQSEFKSFLSLIPGAYTADFANVKTSGKLSFDGFLKGLYSEKQNKMPGYGLNLQIADGFVQYPSVPKAISAINIDCKIDDASGVPDATKIDVNKFHMDFGGNPIDANLHVATPVSDASMNGWLKCKMDLATLKDVMPLAKEDQLNGNINADVKMNGRMSQIEKEQYDQFQLSGNVEVLNMLYKTKDLPYDVNINAMNMAFSPKFVELSKFDGKIGKNDMHATGRIDNLMTYLFKDSLLTGKFDFNSSLMDLNQFMGEDDASASTTAAADTSAMSVIEVPDNIDFTLNSTINKLIYDDINMDQVGGKVTIRNKMVNLDGLHMNLMGGKMVMGGLYNATNPMKPKVKFNLDIADFDMQQTFKTFNTVQKLVPVSKNATGRFSTKLDYTSDLGTDMMPVLETMNGAGTLSTKQVVIDGFEPMKKLDEALKLNKFKKVTLQDIALKYKIENGCVSTEPFDFKVGNNAAKMGGKTCLDESINYVMDVAIPRTEFGPANAALNGMVSSATSKGIPVKLGDVVNVQALFGGTVTKPTVTTNLKEAAGNLADNIKQAVTDTVKAIVQNQVQNATDQACAEADKKLNEAKTAAANAKTQAYKVADDAKAASDKEADALEKKGGNPLEKAANKTAAKALRDKAAKTLKDAKAAADKTEADAIVKAQAEHDAKCKK